MITTGRFGTSAPGQHAIFYVETDAGTELRVIGTLKPPHNGDAIVRG
jgi:hypothetical protein